MKSVLSINKNQILKNCDILRKKTSAQFFCPMVKANAYGLGDSLIVKTLLDAGASNFGVARLSEGLKLRRFFPTKNFDVLVFHPIEKESIELYIESGLTITLGSWDDLNFLKNLSADEKKQLRPLHVKFDLGMSRLGFSLGEAALVNEELRQAGLLVGGVCGHFYDVESSQGATFELLLKAGSLFGLKEHEIHGPSTVILEGSNSFEVGVRPGLGLYCPSGLESKIGLKGVAQLNSPVIHKRLVKKGEGVSYAHAWVASEDTEIAVLPIGYADGLRRGLSNRIKFKNKDDLYSQVGFICMDYTMVNLGLESKVKVGDSLELFGQDLKSLFEWAEILETIPYEILTGLGSRIERKLI